jgi:hypothetical protein
MIINFIMGPGWANSVDDAVNRGLARIMANIRSSLSTANIGFETADLGIFFSSTSSIAALIGYAKRVLESYTVWKDRNYAYPRALIKAQGFDYVDIANNINTYSARLNAAIDMYNGMNLLDCFDVYDRQYSMCHNIFADEDSEFGQLYIFRPINYYVYDDEDIPSKAANTQIAWTVPFTDFGEWLDLIDEAIQSWYGSTDLYQINGVLLRAFKEAPRQSIPHFVQGDTIDPVVDRSFLMQIMNCTIMGWTDPTTCDITQEPSTQNYVIWKPKLDSTSPAYNPVSSTMLRLFENDVSNEDNMELTRLVNFVDENGFLTNCGTEIVAGIDMLRYDTTTNSADIHTIGSNEIVLSEDDPASQIHLINSIQPFRYIPAIHIVGEPGLYGVRYLGTLGDVYNWMLYTRIDWHTLQFVAYQSLWTPKNL